MLKYSHVYLKPAKYKFGPRKLTVTLEMSQCGKNFAWIKLSRIDDECFGLIQCWTNVLQQAMSNTWVTVSNNNWARLAMWRESRDYLIKRIKTFCLICIRLKWKYQDWTKETMFPACSQKLKSAFKSNLVIYSSF